ncbi:MAG: 3-hydroxybutyrate dehydrogenase [Chloroflexi bacterium]|nr:3-hydroxybutyrate dehydrogenase [Chloroflexota bacterium]
MNEDGARSDLAGRVAIVTGAASGIGRAIATQLAASGARVVVADIDGPGADLIAADLPGAWPVTVDVSSPEACADLVAGVLERAGKIDILVNDAGVQFVAPLHEFPPERFEHLLRVLLLGPAMLIRAALPAMYAAGWGRIVNIGSINSLIAHPNKSAYVAAKHGLLGLTRAVALEAGPHGVTVNCVCPAFVRTPLVERQIVDLARTEGLAVDEVRGRVMLGPSAIKRLIEPGEVAAYVGYLCSDAAASITGSAQLIDGGWTAR